jgi:hypothetical protein
MTYSSCKDLTGQKFGRITVISKHSVNKHQQWEYNCICDCGNEKIIVGNSLSRGSTRSCGCYRKEKASGNSSNSWKGGIAIKNEKDRKKIIKKMRSRIRKRDSNTCQNCGAKNTELHCHHIYDMQNYKDLSCIESNLITLCKHCHVDDFHKIYPNNKTNTLFDLESWLGYEYKYRNELLIAYYTYYPDHKVAP